MRVLAGIAVALVLLVSAMPVEAKPDHPFPKTEGATRAFVRDVLVDTDATGADMIRKAQKLVREAQRIGEKIPAIPLPVPGLPDTTMGELDIRASLVQPGVRGVDQTVGAMWLGASEGHWTGAYWLESEGGNGVFPALMDIDETGVIMFVDGGALATGNSINVTYHFLGFDGKHTIHRLGQIPIYDAMPVLDRVDVGGAHASARGKEPEALLITPWNLFDHNITMGMTLQGADAVLDDITLAACEDYQVPEVEPGCRLLYVLPFTAELERVSIWHLDENGERVVDRELSRAQLLDGHTFSR